MVAYIKGSAGAHQSPLKKRTELEMLSGLSRTFYGIEKIAWRNCQLLELAAVI